MTLEIKTGDWAVLRNGEVRGPLTVADPKEYPFPIFIGHAPDEISWTMAGSEYDEPHITKASDIISTLPTYPLEHIRALEARIGVLEEALRAWEKWEAKLVLEGSDRLWDELGDISEIQAIRNSALEDRK